MCKNEFFKVQGLKTKFSKFKDEKLTLQNLGKKKTKTNFIQSLGIKIMV